MIFVVPDFSDFQRCGNDVPVNGSVLAARDDRSWVDLRQRGGVGQRPRSTKLKARTDSVTRQFDVVIERDSEGYYVASVPQIPACHTQARSLDEVTERIREAIQLCLEVEGTPEQDLEFVGIQRVTIAA
jgi:predicted RNase H-like HicB family nuclease